MFTINIHRLNSDQIKIGCSEDRRNRMSGYQEKRYEDTWIIEIIAALALVICVFVDVFVLPDFDKSVIAVDIILILLPSIITIVTLSLSMPREKIYGLDRVRFNRLRGPWCFRFLEMIVITIAIFFVYTICFALKYYVTMLCLECESTFFSLYFAIQEIPLLTQSDKYIQWILKKRYYSFSPSFDLGVQQEQDDFTNVICYLILTQGIKTTYFSMKSNDAKKNANLLNYLLTIQNNYFFASISDLSIIKANPSGEFQNIIFSKAIDKGFDNVDDLLRLGDDFDFSEILDGKQDVYLITRSIFCLRELAEAFDLQSKEREKFQDILFTLSCQLSTSGKHQQVCLNLLNLMLCNTVPDGQMWFAEFLRDSYFPLTFFPQDNEPYGFFLLCLLNSINSNSAIDPKCKQAIITFLSEPGKSPNGNGLSLLEQVRDTMSYLPGRVIVPSLAALLKIYRSSSEEAYLFSTKSQGFMGSDLIPLLSESNLVDDWVEIILYDSWAEPYPDELSNGLKTFRPEDQLVLVKTLQRNWFKDGQFNSSYTSGFLSFIGIKNSPKSVVLDKKSEELLANYANDFQIDELMKKAEVSLRTSSSYEPDMQKMGNGLDSAIKKYGLYESTLKMESYPVRSFSLRLDDRFLEDSINLYIQKYNFLFGSLIKEKMDLAKIKTFSRGSFRFSEQDIDQIRSFGADQMCNTGLSDNLGDPTKSALKKFDLPGLPRDCFWQKGAIGINVEFDKTGSVARKLTSDEVNQIIDHEYAMINGLYKVGDTGEIGTSVLMTREQLFNFLIRYSCLFTVSFRYVVFVDSEKILLFLPPKD
jgi:hypothetical protein